MKLLKRLAICTVILMPAVAAADEVCSPIAIEHVTQPQRAYKSTGLENARKVVERANKDAEILLLGDSHPERWKTDALNAALAPQTVTNLSVGGDRTQQVLWRLEQMDTSAFSPETVVLWLGTNNLSDREPACAIGMGLAKIADEIQVAWPAADLIVVETPPRGVNFEDKMPDRIDMYRVMEANSDVEMTFINVDDAMACGFEPFPESYFAPVEYRKRRPTPCLNYEDDLHHISTQGYDIMNEALLKVVQ